MDEFLSRLPDTLTDPGRRFFQLWHEWRRGRKLPERRDIDFDAMGDLARNCLLMDVRNRNDIRIIMAGDGVRERIGVDLTGTNYLDLSAPEHRSARARLTLEQILQPCGAMLYYCLQYADGAVLPLEIVGAPICADGVDIPDFILGCAIPLGRNSSESQADPNSYRLSLGLRFVDLGFGVPPADPNPAASGYATLTP